MNIGIFIFIIVLVLFLVYRRVVRKARGSDCGVICQVLRKPSPPKKPKTYKERKEEVRKRIEEIRKEIEREKRRRNERI